MNENSSCSLNSLLLRVKRKGMSESFDQTKSENESHANSEAYKSFENVAVRLGTLTRTELDEILEKDKEEKRYRKTSRNWLCPNE